ncbi:hypothetical protein HK101_006366, partial [Irineochytrium annulatum]
MIFNLADLGLMGDQAANEETLKLLSNVLLRYIGPLKKIYSHYCNLGVSTQPVPESEEGDNRRESAISRKDLSVHEHGVVAEFSYTIKHDVLPLGQPKVNETDGTPEQAGNTFAVELTKEAECKYGEQVYTLYARIAKRQAHALPNAALDKTDIKFLDVSNGPLSISRLVENFSQTLPCVSEGGAFNLEIELVPYEFFVAVFFCIVVKSDENLAQEAQKLEKHVSTASQIESLNNPDSNTPAEVIAAVEVDVAPAVKEDESKKSRAEKADKKEDKATDKKEEKASHDTKEKEKDAKDKDSKDLKAEKDKDHLVAVRASAHTSKNAVDPVPDSLHIKKKDSKEKELKERENVEREQPAPPAAPAPIESFQELEELPPPIIVAEGATPTPADPELEPPASNTGSKHELDELDGSKSEENYDLVRKAE